MSAPERPVDVPAGAVYFPPADTFAELEAHSKLSRRGQLRVLFPFVILRIRGAMAHVHHRCITAKATRYGQAYAWMFTSEGPVPGVWAWTLADERAARQEAEAAS